MIFSKKHPDYHRSKASPPAPPNSARQLFETQGICLVNKHEAAAILRISPETLKKYRLKKNSTLVEGIHYFVWNSRVIKYNAPLLLDWAMNCKDPQAHQMAIDTFLASLPSNQPAKRERRKG